MSEQRILIADDDVDVRSTLAIRCKSFGLVVDLAKNADDAWRLLQANEYCVACLDVDMPRGGGLSIVDAMAQDARLLEVPVIVLTGKSDPRTIRDCHDHCAYYVLKSPKIWDRVKPLLQSIVTTRRPGTQTNPCHLPCKQTKDFSMAPTHRAARLDSILDILEQNVLQQETVRIQSEASPPKTIISDVDESELPWILSIEDDQDFSRAVKLRLEARGVVVVRAFHGMDGYRLAFTHPAKAVLLDYNLPGGQGDYVLRRLKENPLTAEIPVIVITGRKEHNVARTMYNLGAAAYLTKPLIFDELLAELSKYVDILPDAHLSIDTARQSVLVID